MASLGAVVNVAIFCAWVAAPAWAERGRTNRAARTVSSESDHTSLVLHDAVNTTGFPKVFTFWRNKNVDPNVRITDPNVLSHLTELKKCMRVSGRIACPDGDRLFGEDGATDPYICGKKGSRTTYKLKDDCVIYFNTPWMKVTDSSQGCVPCKFGATRPKDPHSAALGLGGYYTWIPAQCDPAPCNLKTTGYSVWDLNSEREVAPRSKAWQVWQKFKQGLYRIRGWIKKHPFLFAIFKGGVIAALGVASGGAALIGAAAFAGVKLAFASWHTVEAIQELRDGWEHMGPMAKAACSLKIGAKFALTLFYSTGSILMPMLPDDTEVLEEIFAKVPYGELADSVSEDDGEVLGAVKMVLGKLGSVGQKQVQSKIFKGWEKISCDARIVSTGAEPEPPADIFDMEAVDTEHPSDSAVAMRSPCEGGSLCMQARGRIMTMDRELLRRSDLGTQVELIMAADWTPDKAWPYDEALALNRWGARALASDIEWELDHLAPPRMGPAQRAMYGLEEARWRLEMAFAQRDNPSYEDTSHDEDTEPTPCIDAACSTN